MSLQGSFSSGAPKSNRLSQMSSVPTTEDLRYALSESKRHGKPIELPFENNRRFFIIKVAHMGNAAPRWTFQRGEGPNARVMWTRDSAEVLMIQNKIKTESAYENSDDQRASGHQAPYVPEYEEEQGGEGYEQGYDQGYDQGYEEPPPIVPSASMGFGAPSAPIVPPSGTGIPQRGFGVSEAAATSQTGMPAWNPQGGAGSSQQGMPPAQQGGIPQKGFSEQSASGKQAPFQPSGNMEISQKILMPPKLGGFDTGAPSSSPPAQAPAPERSAPAVDPVYQGNDKKGDESKVAFDMSGIFGGAPPADTAGSASSQTRMPAAQPKAPLPAPVAFDQNMINGVYSRLADSRTGLMSFDSLLFFLFREFSRYEKNKTGLTLVIFECVIKQGNQISQLPPEGLPAIAQCIRAVSSPLEIAANIKGGEFAVLLDGADKAAVTKYLDALHRAISVTPVLPNLPANSTVVAIGAATIPGTCDHPGVLVAAAQQAKEMSKGMSPPYLIFPS